MGLDTTHDAWHGAYSAFNRWRDKIGEIAGYTYHEVNSPPGGTYPDIDWGNIQAVIGEDLNGKWEKIPVRPDGTEDPLIILLAHSDCEGKLYHEFLLPLADRLEELLPELEGLTDGGHIGSYVEKTKTFIAGLRRAWSMSEDVEFY